MTGELADRVRSTDFVERVAGQAELGRGLLAYLDREPVTMTFGGLVTGDDVQRAIVDVTSPDLAGHIRPAFVPFPAIPTLPFFTSITSELTGVSLGLDSVSTVRLPSVASLPTGKLDPTEKTDMGTTSKLTVSVVPKNVHMAAVALDVSMAAIQRTDTTTVAAYEALCGLVVQRLLEGAMMDDIVTASTAGTGTTAADVPAAIAQASAAWAPVDVVLAGTVASGKIATQFPLGLGGLPVTVIGASSFASKVLATSRSDLIAMASPFKSLWADIPTLLGRDVGVWIEGVGGVVYSPGSVVLTLS
jgi:hypothetical protein